jgi:mRNA interferase RelE/StbE
MASFDIDWKGSSEHDLRRIDRQYIPRILDVIESLAENPFPVQSKKLRGSEASHRIRVGDYRVIYQIDTKQKTITIYHVRHRKDVYKR